MTTKISSANSAWSSSSHIVARAVKLGVAAILGTLAGCAAPPPAMPPPAAAPAAVAPPAPVAIEREVSRWVKADWLALPGWFDDAHRQVWPALQRSCERPAAAWAGFCAELRRSAPADDAAARDWLMQRLQPFRVEAHDGRERGLITGYFEPLLAARRLPDAAHTVALHMPPADLATRRPYWSREQLDTLPQARAALRGREIAHLADPLDALLLQIQGSGRLLVTEPDGQRRLVRLAFAGHNDWPFRSIGRWLIEQGELAPGQASWPAIQDWARRHPQRVQQMLWVNPRVVFFREEPLLDPEGGPRGAQGVPLTPGRSIAVDPRSVPYGTPVWLDTTEPLASTPLRRLVVAQDTGSAIVGAVRADFFWGWGAQAEAQAGRMMQPLHKWALWPLAAPPR